MYDYAAHDDPKVTPARGRRLLTVLLLTVVGLTGAVSTAAASVGQPAALGSPATVTRPIPGDEGREKDTDDEPCNRKVETKSGETGLICPDWSPTGSIEVFEKPDADSKVIGRINPAGDDFYFCQIKGGDHRLGKFVNNWWARTDADGKAGSGWVPETYFKGGGPNVKDEVLQDCPPQPRT